MKPCIRNSCILAIREAKDDVVIYRVVSSTYSGLPPSRVNTVWMLRATPWHAPGTCLLASNAALNPVSHSGALSPVATS